MIIHWVIITLLFFHVFRSIIADLESSFKLLAHFLDQSLSVRPEERSAFSPIDAQIAIIFDLNVLSQLSNASKAVIGVS